MAPLVARGFGGGETSVGTLSSATPSVRFRAPARGGGRGLVPRGLALTDAWNVSLPSGVTLSVVPLRASPPARMLAAPASPRALTHGLAPRPRARPRLSSGSFAASLVALGTRDDVILLRRRVGRGPPPRPRPRRAWPPRVHQPRPRRRLPREGRRRHARSGVRDARRGVRRRRAVLRRRALVRIVGRFPRRLAPRSRGRRPGRGDRRLQVGVRTLRRGAWTTARTRTR